MRLSRIVGQLSPLSLHCLSQSSMLRDVLLEALVEHIDVPHRLLLCSVGLAHKLVEETLVIVLQFIFYFSFFLIELLY